MDRINSGWPNQYGVRVVQGLCRDTGRYDMHDVAEAYADDPVGEIFDLSAHAWISI